MSREASIVRVRRFVESARRLGELSDPWTERAVTRLSATTGLSEAGVRHALTHCLELDPTAQDLQRLTESVAQAPRAHVSLSANVFTAPLRAIALALAAAPEVKVRASRREPVFSELLHELSGGAFELVSELEARAGEQVFCYGADETLAAIELTLPAGVVFHGHGAGIGVAVVDGGALATQEDLAARLALDTVAFDQRGCLSPRLVLVDADLERARGFARDVARELARLQETLASGALLEGEKADTLRYRATLTFLGEVYDAGTGMVAFDAQARGLPIPPTGRNLLIARCNAPAEHLEPIASAIAALGLACESTLSHALEQRFGRARRSDLGSMQRPRLDGPVDKRTLARVL